MAKFLINVVQDCPGTGQGITVKTKIILSLEYYVCFLKTLDNII